MSTRARRAASATRAGPRTAAPPCPTRTRTTSCDGRIAVVHNGIIENFAELREELAGRGHRVHERHRHRGLRPPHRGGLRGPRRRSRHRRAGAPGTRDLMAAVREACTHVVGAYGLAAVCADEPGVIAVARKDSPIVIGRSARPAATWPPTSSPLIDATRDVVVLEDGQFARLTPEGVTYTDAEGALDRARRHPHRLGHRHGGEGRPPRLHAQGDPRAAARGARHPRGAPARAPASSTSTSSASPTRSSTSSTAST